MKFSKFFNTITSLVLASVYSPVNSTLLPSDKVESYRSLLSDFGISCTLRNHDAITKRVIQAHILSKAKRLSCIKYEIPVVGELCI